MLDFSFYLLNLPPCIATQSLPRIVASISHYFPAIASLPLFLFLHLLPSLLRLSPPIATQLFPSYCWPSFSSPHPVEYVKMSLLLNKMFSCVQELVEHMTNRKPEMRLSAEEYLIKQRGKAFPEFFYTFFKTYSQQFATVPIMPSDDRILM